MSQRLSAWVALESSDKVAESADVFIWLYLEKTRVRHVIQLAGETCLATMTVWSESSLSSA